ncbi:hypothetical protein [Nocardioides sp. Root140]|uniref:hypothetical protein n=1 Tax=Nocardioides sp. Root140 TaxID=1736460 RepID=UPI0006F411A6|nr:hypothetical protein [Nocardioides sp. Root140]KQY56821.1 hypothetical protein ASD30_11005 [Nocardioides sp. Root140]
MRGWFAAAVIVAPFAMGVAAADTGPRPDVVCSFKDPAINESSGLVVRPDTMITMNDSGDTARVFFIDPDDCSTTSQRDYPGIAKDVEAIAPAADGEQAVWVADIGDNRASRHDLAVVRVPFDGSSTDRHEVSWQGGPEDAETLMVHPVTGRLYAVTKGVLGGQVLEAPATLGPGRNVFKPVGETSGLITDGAFFPDGLHFVLRNYGKAYVYDTATMSEIGDFELPSQQQGEGLAVGPDDRIYLSSEGVHAKVLRVDVPRPIREAMDAGSSPSGTASPDAGASGTASPDASASDGDTTSASSDEDSQRDVWPWAVGGLFGLAAVVVLLRSLKPR